MVFYENTSGKVNCWDGEQEVDAWQIERDILAPCPTCTGDCACLDLPWFCGRAGTGAPNFFWR